MLYLALALTGPLDPELVKRERLQNVELDPPCILVLNLFESSAMFRWFRYIRNKVDNNLLLVQ